MQVSGIEAHFLLLALDAYVGVDAQGHILSTKHGYSRGTVQNLRDRLFKHHEHPAWEGQEKRLSTVCNLERRK